MIAAIFEQDHSLEFARFYSITLLPTYSKLTYFIGLRDYKEIR